jgi:hypothetical protein
MAISLPPTTQDPPKPSATPYHTVATNLKSLLQPPTRAAEENERSAAPRSSSLGTWWKTLRPSHRPEKGSTIREERFWDEPDITKMPLHQQAHGNLSMRRDGMIDSGHMVDWSVPTVIPEPPKSAQPGSQRAVSTEALTESSDLEERRFSFAPKAQIPEYLSLGQKESTDGGGTLPRATSMEARHRIKDPSQLSR